MIDGCLDYLRDGLNPPASALAATEDYLESEDVIGQWLNERCVVHPSEGWTSLASLFLDWQTWAHPRGYTSGTSKTLSKQLDERGLKRKKTMHGQGFEGVRILPLVQSGAAAAAGHDGNDDNDASSYFTRNPHPRARRLKQAKQAAHTGEIRTIVIFVMIVIPGMPRGTS